MRTCNALDEAEWSKAFDDQVTCAFLYLVPRGLRLVAPRLIERSKTRPIRVVTYMAPLPGATYVEKTTVTPAHQPSAAWPLYAYDLGVATVKVCVVGRDASLVVGAIARYHLLQEDDEAQPVDEAVVRFPRTRYGVTNVELTTQGEGPFAGYIVLASERWKDYVTAAHTSDAPLRLLADAGGFNADHARCAVQVDFEYVHGVDVSRPKRGCGARDKDGVPRIFEALRVVVEPAADAPEIVVVVMTAVWVFLGWQDWMFAASLATILIVYLVHPFMPRQAEANDRIQMIGSRFNPVDEHDGQSANVSTNMSLSD